MLSTHSSSDPASAWDPPPGVRVASRFRFLLSALQRLLQVDTSSQQRSHFFLQVNGLPHVTQIFCGRFCFPVAQTRPRCMPQLRRRRSNLTPEMDRSFLISGTKPRERRFEPKIVPFEPNRIPCTKFGRPKKGNATSPTSMAGETRREVGHARRWEDHGLGGASASNFVARKTPSRSDAGPR